MRGGGLGRQETRGSSHSEVCQNAVIDRTELGVGSLRGEQVSSETAWSGPPPPLLTCKLLQGRDACCYPKGHEARCPLGPRRQRSGEGAVSLLTKGFQGPGEGGGRGESQEAGQEARERTVGWRHGWMDRGREEGRMYR